MKNIKIKYIIPAILLLTLGCTGDFDEINTNPNTLTASQLDGSFAGPSFATVLYKGINHGSWALPGDDHGTYGLITMLHSMVFSHYLSASWATTETYGLRDDWRSRGWTRFYTLAVPALNNTYLATEGNAEATAILDIWKVFIYHRMTDEWGPIPYFQAGNGAESVTYDSQEAIYENFFDLLEAANTTLGEATGSTVEVFQAHDAIYGGDIDKWRRFGNSLRLRLALRISDVDAAKAKTEGEAAVAAGVIESNDGSAYYDINADFFNNFVAIAPTWGFVMSASMESILEGYSDPRMEVWFTPDSLGNFIGRPSGGPSDNTVSVVNNATFGGDAGLKDMEVMLASETYFNRAEGVLNGWSMGTGTAQSLYEEGIRLSMNQWGITDNTAIDTYIAGATTGSQPTLVTDYTNAGISATPPVDVPVAFAATEAEQRKQIAVQKYLALFPESWESWSDLRRTDADILYPLISVDDPNISAGLIKRLTYLPNEYSTNREAVDAAVSTLPGGRDLQSVGVWWDVD